MTISETGGRVLRAISELHSQDRAATADTIAEASGFAIGDVLGVVADLVSIEFIDHPHSELGVLAQGVAVSLTANGWLWLDERAGFDPVLDLEQKGRALAEAHALVDELMDWSPTRPGQPMPETSAELASAMNAEELAEARRDAALSRYLAGR